MTQTLQLRYASGRSHLVEVESLDVINAPSMVTCGDRVFEFVTYVFRSLPGLPLRRVERLCYSERPALAEERKNASLPE